MDYFNNDSIFELIEKSKKNIRDEMDTITFDNDKLSKESDKLLQILEYSPKTKLLEKDIIKSLPVIKLKQPNEEKKTQKAQKHSRHSKLPSTPNIEFSFPQNMANQENIEIVEDILFSIIDDAIEKSANKGNDKLNNSKNEDSDEDDDEYERLMAQRQKQMEEREKKIEKENNGDDDEDDEYERLMAQRQKQMEEREKKIEKENEDDDDDLGMKKQTQSEDLSQAGKKKGKKGAANTSRLSTAMNLLTKLKVYLFRTKKSFDINISPTDTVKSIKTQIIKFLIDNKYDLKYTSENAYDIRAIEEGEKEPNMDYPPLENNTLIFMARPKAIAFLENPKYNPNQDYSSQKILGNVSTIKSQSSFYDKNKGKNNQNANIQINENDNNAGTEKMNIKVYFKANGINSSKIISLSSEDNLKGILKLFFNQDILLYKNFDFYYFVEHKSSQEIDNAINLETNIKYLPSYELNLCYKNFPDLPDAMNAYNKGMMLNTGNDKKTSKNEKDDEANSGGNFFFNEISAGLYQEYEVVKINKFKSKQERILGIDMYNLYNNLPKKKTGGLMNFIFKETKKPRRKMKNVKACAVIGDKTFYIDIKNEESDEVKRSSYEVKNNLIRDEIVAKINFLIKLNQENSN